MSSYFPRITDTELKAHMKAMGAVLIEGPKACGKTATASQVANTVINLDSNNAIRSLVSLNPEQLFSGEAPILFDEWQLEPDIWNKVRRQVDTRGSVGQFILTGSATPRDDARRHSGAGRISVLRMRTMSLFESKHSTGEVSLAALFQGETQTGDGTHLSYDELLKRVVIGGWPQLIDKDEDFARSWLVSYLKQIIEVDIPALGNRRNPRNLERLFVSLARNVAQAVKQSELAKDVGGAETPITSVTISSYLDALDRLKITDNSESWRPHMRSRTRLRATPVRYFTDPSFATAALDVGSKELGADPEAAGFHFEALVVRDLRVYAQLMNATVSSWRDANGNEVDAIVHTRNGKWAAFEIKLNPKQVDQGAVSLLRFAESVDTKKHGDPVALGVITSTGYAGKREDGVSVIPIGTLGP